MIVTGKTFFIGYDPKTDGYFVEFWIGDNRCRTSHNVTSHSLAETMALQLAEDSLKEHQVKPEDNPTLSTSAKGVRYDYGYGCNREGRPTSNGNY